MSLEGERPHVWVGHIALPTPDIPGTYAFMLTLGMRGIAEREAYAILELRGGTHLVLQSAEGPFSGSAGFDLMVEDLEATHGKLAALGLDPSPIEQGAIHAAFRVDSPSGHSITVHSSHVSDQPV